MYQGQM